MSINIHISEPQITDCSGMAFVMGTTIICTTYPLKIHENPSYVCYAHMVMSGVAACAGSFTMVQTTAGKYFATGVCVGLAGYTGYKFISDTFFSK